MITKIEAKNYRCLRAVAQRLEGFHVIAGPNGSGKSTFFEIPRILGAFGRDGLTSLWESSGAQSLEELLFLGQGQAFELAVEMTVPEELRGANHAPDATPVIRYEVRIGREKTEEDEPPKILAENLWLLPKSISTERREYRQEEFAFPSPSADLHVVHDGAPRGAGWRPVAKKTKAGNSYFRGETTDWNLQIRNSAEESSLRALPSDDRFPISNWFRQRLVEGVRQLALSSDVMRRPSGALKRQGFRPDGSNLPHVVAHLQSDRAGFRAWHDHLRTVLPIHRVDVVTREEDKSRYLRVAYDYAKDSYVPSWHLSDGTLRMLALTLLAYLPDNRGTYLIEEPENGIHPQAMEAVFQSLSSVYEGQVLVATHSPVLVGLVKPSQLLCFSKTPSGETDIVTGAQHPKLQQWKHETSLSRLYAAGVLS